VLAVNLSSIGVCVIAEPDRNRTGAPGSPKRTWAEKDIFRLLSQPRPGSAGQHRKNSGGLPLDFPVEIGGVVELYAVFPLRKPHTRPLSGPAQQETRVRWGEVVHPSHSYWALV
jgi:hypothetical protein